MFCNRYNVGLVLVFLLCKINVFPTGLAPHHLKVSFPLNCFLQMTYQVCNFVPMSSFPHDQCSHTKGHGALIPVQTLMRRPDMNCQLLFSLFRFFCINEFVILAICTMRHVHPVLLWPFFCIFLSFYSLSEKDAQLSVFVCNDFMGNKPQISLIQIEL